MELRLVLQTTFYNALRTHCFGLRNHPYRCLRIIHKLHMKLPTIFTVVSFATLSMKLFPFPTVLSTTIHCIVRSVFRYFIFGRVYSITYIFVCVLLIMLQITQTTLFAAYRYIVLSWFTVFSYHGQWHFCYKILAMNLFLTYSHQVTGLHCLKILH